MGKVYLIISCIVGSWFVSMYAFSQDRIILAPEPEPIDPPSPDPEQGNRDLQRLRKRRKKREGTGLSKFGYYRKKRNLELGKAAGKKGPYRFMTQTSIVLPTILAQGPRSNYTSELTTHISAVMRFSDKNPFSQHTWWGIRIAPYAGTGTYKETAGRYNFFNFGPMFGIGSINRSGLIEEKESKSKPKNRPNAVGKNIPKTTAWFLMGGIAAHTRIVEVDPTDEVADKEMNTTNKPELDGPGIWAEFTYANIYFGSLGVHYMAGVQIGEEKVFLWLGVGAGGWY